MYACDRMAVQYLSPTSIVTPLEVVMGRTTLGFSLGNKPVRLHGLSKVHGLFSPLAALFAFLLGRLSLAFPREFFRDLLVHL